MKWNAKWIKPASNMGDVATVFAKQLNIKKEVKKAVLSITCLGVYEASIGGRRVGEFVLAPGWTTYYKRLQYQTYDVTDYLEGDAEVRVLVGKGWYRSRLGWTTSDARKDLREEPTGLLAQLDITYADGTTEQIVTDENWTCGESKVRFSEIYDGEIFDATFEEILNGTVAVFEGPWDTLIAQEGEEVREQEVISAINIITTPKGEVVVDFGQEMTGYVETTVDAKEGDVVDLSFAEVFDKDGNFYNENYRSAKATYHYICKDGKQTYKPKLTFWGFRYIRINEFPGGPQNVRKEAFRAVVVHSEMKRTGYLECSNAKLNQFFSNVIWGQKGNFLDIPTDCPQRDERLGWTGDAQVFVRAAAINYDVEKFFLKWMKDVAADQYDSGCIGVVCPNIFWSENEEKQIPSAAWSDVATVVPWQIYMAYGNAQILKNQFTSMKKWVNYVTEHTEKPNLWTGAWHYGDWLGLDAPSGSFEGSTRKDVIASAFYAYSTSLVIKAGKVLGEDVSEYETLYKKIVEAFRLEYPEYETQTECILALYFGLAEDMPKTAKQLADMIVANGTAFQTGFVGTPYLLHVLSENGYIDLAYALLLREEYPSWLYQVSQGATTIWEHWDGIMENGDFWATDMNSFNHYAYGSAIDWVYSVAAGITPEKPGYEKIRIAPIPSERLDWLKCKIETRHGEVSSEWKKQDGVFRYEITTPVDATIVIGGVEHQVTKGTYYYS